MCLEVVDRLEQLPQRAAESIEPGDAQAVAGAGVVDEIGEAGMIEAPAGYDVGEDADGAGFPGGGRAGPRERRRRRFRCGPWCTVPPRAPRSAHRGSGPQSRPWHSRSVPRRCSFWVCGRSGLSTNAKPTRNEHGNAVPACSFAASFTSIPIMTLTRLFSLSPSHDMSSKVDFLVLGRRRARLPRLRRHRALRVSADLRADARRHCRGKKTWP